jgi:ubiquinone/menaquinone biosynthesis C-methylase UbiE
VSQGWEDRAEGWIAWARKPSHDAYAFFRDAMFELLPQPRGRALEVGCGEGRVCRDLRELGYDVVGLDAAPTLVAAAHATDPDGQYVVGAAEELPFPDDVFDLVVAYNSLMDVADMPCAVAEAARVLVPGGQLVACVTHPMRARGSWEPRRDGDVYVIERTYFEPYAYTFHAARGELEFTFESRTYPLSDYASALERAGLVIEALREPEGVDAHDRFIPEFLMFRAAMP